MAVITDPREFPLSCAAPTPAARAFHLLAERCLSGETAIERSDADTRLSAALLESIATGDFAGLESAVGTAPSPAIARQLLRVLAHAWHASGTAVESGLIPHGFAMPIVIVAGAPGNVELPAVLKDVQPIAELLVAHRALAGNRAFGLANALAGAESTGIRSLARWRSWRELPDAAEALREVRPATLRIQRALEGAHLVYLIGSALAAGKATLFADQAVGAWGMPVAREMSRQLTVEGVQLLALPRAPADPLTAAMVGRAAHREVALQLFAGNAIRRLRADFGEPSAVISAHRADGEGELRVSLSSPFGERDAEGFRVPLFEHERVEDTLGLIVDLLRACRVHDIRVMAGVHGERDPSTGLPLFFRADAPDAGRPVPFH